MGDLIAFFIDAASEPAPREAVAGRPPIDARLGFLPERWLLGIRFAIQCQVHAASLGTRLLRCPDKKLTDDLFHLSWLHAMA